MVTPVLKIKMFEKIPVLKLKVLTMTVLKLKILKKKAISKLKFFKEMRA